MELRQLRYFLAVAEELHFGRAARRLHISQAPLSAQIQKLEQEVGHRLFHRTTRRVRLTDVGDEFYRRAAAVVQEADELTSDLGQIAQGRAGRLRLGFVSSASYELLPRAIRRFRELAPQVNLELEPMTSAEQTDALRDGRLDLGIVRGAEGLAELSAERIVSEQIVACLPRDHWLADADEVSARQLAQEHLIFFPPREMPGYAAEIRPLFSSTGFPPVYARIIQQETALGFVSAGLGYTLLPASVSAFAPPTVHLAYIEEQPMTSIYAAFGAEAASGAAQLFRKVLGVPAGEMPGDVAATSHGG